MPTHADETLPYLTGHLTGTGGVIRSTPEDFRVEEKPLYLPCGQGEHLYLSITKCGLSTPQLVSKLSSTLGVKAQGIGVAGLKDARAVTTQMVSVHGATPELITRLKTDEQVRSIEILGRHRNRLRPGHHSGNTFRLVIRKTEPSASAVVPQIMEELTKRGVPNYFGPQRQGRQGTNFEVGAALLYDEQRRNKMPRAKRIWYLNAYQSILFNRILSKRIARIDRILVGDWAMKHANGACFHVEDAAVEQKRVDVFEISPTGVLFGSRASWATGEPGGIEREVAAEFDATPESLLEAGKACGFRGERRALRVKLESPNWSVEGDTVTVSFTLPPGAYATNVLRELTKIYELG
ncbi:MAG: tRNA pseudouridine(13) synthase TruD [Nitrospira sp.]|nr:tRNA pseudouridine(13) synthase TruD [Nitrospira sp.]